MTILIKKLKEFIALMLFISVFLVESVSGNSFNNEISINSFMFNKTFPNGIEGIYPEAIVQAVRIGDCQAVSAISSLVRSEYGRKLMMSYFSFDGAGHIEVEGVQSSVSA